MFKFFAKLFGYLLNFLNDLFGNYGLAIIVFSVVVKFILLPLTIKQQKSLKKANEMQAEMQKIKEKYGNDTEKLNQEVIELYKRTGASPFSGCFISIIQFILIISVFIMVRSPLTYVKKIDTDTIQKYSTQLNEKGNNSKYIEVDIIREFGEENKDVKINMNFLSIDLSTVPTEDAKNIKGWIIPVLYVITAILSMKLTNKKQKSDAQNQTEEQKQMNETMSYMMPIMTVSIASIAIIAPLGLSLYWFMSNILMIIERICIDVIQNKKEEAEL